MNDFIDRNISKPAIWKKLSLFILAVMMVLSAPFNAIAASLSEEPVTVITMLLGHMKQAIIWFMSIQKVMIRFVLISLLNKRIRDQIILKIQ